MSQIQTASEDDMDIKLMAGIKFGGRDRFVGWRRGGLIFLMRKHVWGVQRAFLWGTFWHVGCIEAMFAGFEGFWGAITSHMSRPSSIEMTQASMYSHMNFSMHACLHE